MDASPIQQRAGGGVRMTSGGAVTPSRRVNRTPQRIYRLLPARQQQLSRLIQMINIPSEHSRRPDHFRVSGVCDSRSIVPMLMRDRQPVQLAPPGVPCRQERAHERLETFVADRLQQIAPRCTPGILAADPCRERRASCLQVPRTSRKRHARRRIRCKLPSTPAPRAILAFGTVLCLYQLRGAGIVDVAGDAAIPDARNGLVDDEQRNEKPFLRLHRVTETVVDGDIQSRGRKQPVE